MNRQDAKAPREERMEVHPFDPALMRARPEPPRHVDTLAHDVIGAAIEVHRMLGPGYLESVYEESLAIEMSMRGIPFQRQVPIGIDYKGHEVGSTRVDFIVNELLIVELKAVEKHNPLFEAQVLSYLKATRLQLGLLMNFNVQVLKNGIKRIILS